ncbi:hypothetical protein QBC47DRAFT_278071, partial [Echria macrotheca]
SANGAEIEMPSINLYTNMPADARSTISKLAGASEPRKMYHMLPDRTLVAWSQRQIQGLANQFRAAHPEAAMSVVRPTRWEDLYDYFDAHDLWYKGAWNLWQLVLCICDQNDVEAADQNMSMWEVVYDWTYKWLTHATNRQKLFDWDTVSDIVTIFTPEDWKDVG